MKHGAMSGDEVDQRALGLAEAPAGPPIRAPPTTAVVPLTPMRAATQPRRPPATLADGAAARVLLIEPIG